MMPDLVWNDLFRERMKQDDAKEAIERWLNNRGYEEFREHLGSWEKGAKLKDVPAAGIDGKKGKWPVVRVTLLQAFVFADLLGGRLPRKEQYLKAAGFEEANRPGPFDGLPDDPAVLAELGVSRIVDGPLPVHPPRPRAESVHHIRDLGGNAKEWTRSLFDEHDPREVPLRELIDPASTLVRVLGHGYRNEGPWLFSKIRGGFKDTMPYCVGPDEQISPEIGFRIVIDRESTR